MAFIPDITVKEYERYENLLVVGVEDDTANLTQSAEGIKAYMARTQCVSGLLVSPTHFRIYKNNLYPGTPESVQEVADIPTPHIMGPLPTQNRGPEFDNFVYRWLERLQTNYLTRKISIPADVRDVVQSGIVSALYGTEIWLAGSRWPQAAS